MTPEQIALVTASAERVTPRLAAVSADFYARLFAAHPEVRPMFPADNSGQEVKFAASIEAIVAAIPDFDAFAERTRTLGRLHATHHVAAAHYDAVAGHLLDALAAADPGWDEPTRAAWSVAYDLLAESMMLAARS
jgi:hemoglobin-like flavoprotein